MPEGIEYNSTFNENYPKNFCDIMLQEGGL
jgi:hypothetical protein